MISRSLIGSYPRVILSVILFHCATFCSAVEVSYGINFNNFIYDRLAVSDSLQQFYGKTSIDDTEPFEVAVKDTYKVDFEILKLSYVSRIEIKLTKKLNDYFALNTAFSHGQGEAKYNFPAGISVFKDPAILHANFLENTLSFSTQYEFSLFPKNSIYVELGHKFSTVEIDTKVRSDLLNVRAVQKHLFTQPHVSFGVNGITLNGQTSIRPIILFSDFNEIEKGVEIYISISQKF